MILDTFSKLETLKKERNAMILAHYYQDPDIQDAADSMGDSLALAKQATQTNAEKIINNLPHDEKIIFAPDKHLGSYLKKKTGRNLLLWNGSCQEHEIFSEKELIRLKTRYPQTMVLAHQNAMKIFSYIQIILVQQHPSLNLDMSQIEKNLSFLLSRE